MTYTATTPKVIQALGVGLVIHAPLFEIPDPRRTILLPPALKKQLRGETAAPFHPVALAKPIAAFISGWVFQVSQKKRTDKLFRRAPQPDLERLEGINEVWVLCHRKPKPGWRLLGRFLEKNAFVLLQIEDKRDIGNNYEAIAAKVTADWESYFPQTPAHSGNWIDGYLSGSHYDVDQEKQI